MKLGFVRLAMAMAMTALPSPADSLSTGRTITTKSTSTITSTIDWKMNPVSLNTRRQTRPFPCRRYMTNDSIDDDDEEVRAMKEEIRQMKLEAMEKLNALDRSLDTISNGASINGIDATKVEQPKQQQQQEQGEEEEEEEESKQETKEFVKRVAVSNDPSISSNSGTANIPKSSEAIARSELTLLEDTEWKVVLNIGREPGMSRSYFYFLYYTVLPCVCTYSFHFVSFSFHLRVPDNDLTDSFFLYLFSLTLFLPLSFSHSSLYSGTKQKEHGCQKRGA